MQAENANFGGISVSAAQIRQVLESSEGRQLIAMLQKNGGQTLQSALAAAKRGDSDGAKQAMTALLEEEEAAALLRRMEHG